MPTAEEKPATGSKSAETGQEICARYERLLSARTGWYDPAWRSSASWINPRKASMMGNEKTPGEAGWVDNIFDTTAITAAEKLAAWYVANTSPRNARWFALGCSAKQRARGADTPAAQRWWQMAAGVMLEQLGLSSFYKSKHEAVLDLVAFGTASLGTLKSKSNVPFYFKSLDVASYVLAANAEGEIDTVIRELKLTLRQAVQQFGLDSLPTKMKDAWRSGVAADRDKEWDFLHAVYPNYDRDPQYEDDLNKKFKSCYVAKAEKLLVQEGGFDDMPYAVCRYLKWTGEVWGWAPAFAALPVVRETNFFKMQMSALAEKAAFPSMLYPDNLVGTLDLRAGGKNHYDHNLPDAVPKPLHDVGEFNVGLELIRDNREIINRCFHGDVIALFANLEKEVTAFEAQQLLSEKLDAIGPEYDRIISELDTPTLHRVFSICLEEGLFGDSRDIPIELVDVSKDGSPDTIDVPEVSYLSRLALAIQAHEVASFDALIARATQLAAIDPSVALQFLENYDLDACARGLGRNLGVPVSWQTDPRVVAIKRAEAAKQAQMAAMAQAAPGIASAAKNVSEMTPQAQERTAQVLGNAA